MRRLTSFVIAFAAATFVASSAMAASFVFDVVRTAALNVSGGAVCPDPCYQVRVFAEDASRSSQIQAVQLEVKVAGANLVNLAVPPATNGNAAAGNTNLEDADGNVVTAPWNLSSTTGASPTAGNYALIVDASDTLFSVNSLKQARTDASGCTATAICTIQLDGLDRLNGIYLGRFNLSGVTAATTFTPVGVTGDGELLAALGLAGGVPVGFSTNPADANYFNSACAVNGRCGTSGPLAPEPASAILLGAALMGLSLVRRRI